MARHVPHLLWRYLGRRRDRLVIRRQRIVRADDVRDSLESNLADARVVARERVDKAETRGAIRRAHRHGLSQRADDHEAVRGALEQLDLDVFRVALAAEIDGDLARLPHT